jgi:WD40 repeat protein
VLTFQGENWRVNSLAFAPDARCLALAQHLLGRKAKSIIRIWWLSEPAKQPEKIRLNGHVVDIGFVSGLLAASTVVEGGGRLLLIDPRNSRIPLDQIEIEGGFLNAVILPDQSLLVAWPKRLGIWKVVDNKLQSMSTTQLSEHRVQEDGVPHRLNQVAISPDGKRIAIMKPTQRTRWFEVDIHDVHSGVPLAKSFSRNGLLTSLTWSPCGRFLAGEIMTRVVVWDAESGNEVVELSAGDTSLLRAPCFHPSGKFLAAGGANLEGGVYCWDTETWREIVAYRWSVGPVMHIVFHPEGTLAAACGERGQITIWDVDL